MRHLSPGDVIAYDGVPAVVWSKSPSTVQVFTVRQARGPHHRAEVHIGYYALSPLTGPLLVSINLLVDLPCDADAIVIGKLTRELRNDIRRAMLRDNDACRVESAYAPGGMFAVCAPRFRSGGHRVGVKSAS